MRASAFDTWNAAFATLAGLAGLAGCAIGGHGPATPLAVAPAAPSDVARVCVVRPEREAGDLVMRVRDNGRLVGATRGATFTCWLAAPGDHQIVSESDDTGPTLLRARAGGRYWLHQDVMAVPGETHAHLDWVDDAEAAEMIAACDGPVRASVPGHEEAADAMAFAPALR